MNNKLKDQSLQGKSGEQVNTDKVSEKVYDLASRYRRATSFIATEKALVALLDYVEEDLSQQKSKVADSDVIEAPVAGAHTAKGTSAPIVPPQQSMRDAAKAKYRCEWSRINIDTQEDFEAGWLAAMQQGAQPLQPLQTAGVPTHVVRTIVCAYEQGVGKGHDAQRSGKEIANPYGPGWSCDKAWLQGYAEGKQQVKNIAQPKETK